LAQAWRLATREIFTTYLARGYEVTDFLLDLPRRRGTYVLALSRTP
jgi:predicted GNAT superfamily acetyltransferase